MIAIRDPIPPRPDLADRGRELVDGAERGPVMPLLVRAPCFVLGAVLTVVGTAILTSGCWAGFTVDPDGLGSFWAELTVLSEFEAGIAIALGAWFAGLGAGCMGLAIAGTPVESVVVAGFRAMQRFGAFCGRHAKPLAGLTVVVGAALMALGFTIRYGALFVFVGWLSIVAALSVLLERRRTPEPGYGGRR